MNTLKYRMARMTLLCVCVWCATGTVFAQKDAEARKILDKASSAFSKAGGVEIGFTVKGDQTMTGTLKVKGSKFQLLTSSSSTWYDGTTQWTYLKSSDEVNVSTPTAEQLQQINPQTWLNVYKKKFNYKYNGVSGNSYKITLTPEQSNRAIKSVVLLLNRTTYAPVQIVLTTPDGKSHTISVQTYLTGKSYSEATFRFDPKAYPRAEVIDLR